MNPKPLECLGDWRRRAFIKGKSWELHKEVLRTFDAAVEDGVSPKLAYATAVTTWEVERPRPKLCQDHHRFLLNIWKPKRPPLEDA